jgi:putative transposase
VAKRTIGRYPKAFRKMAVERLKGCDNILGLSKARRASAAAVQVARSVGGDRRRPRSAGELQERELCLQVSQLKRLVAGQDAGSRFFQRCLAKSGGSTPEQRESWRNGIYDRIRELMSMQGNLSIERMCQLAGVSRAGFYRSLQENQPVEEDMEVRSTIQLIFAEHRRRYGYRRVSAELRRRGMLVNHKRVARLMREDNLLAVQPKAFVVTTDSDHELEVYLNLASRMKLTGVNQLWVADITYIRLHREFVFLAVILDAFSRKVVGWELDRTLAARLPIAAGEGDRGTKAAAGRGASFRSRRPVCIGRLRRGATQTRHDPKHESACESLRQRQLRELHEDS